jgi:glutathionyl-hydroquinone reductase
VKGDHPEPGRLYACPRNASHPGWIVRVLKVSQAVVEVTVVVGQRRGKGARFRFEVDRFVRQFQPCTRRR